jgi:hypothetical protein
MMQVHPDNEPSSRENYAYNAQEINIAYAILKKEISTGSNVVSHNRQSNTVDENKHSAWDAPVNIYAYREREILQYAEDYDGSAFGHFCIAKGKYLWKTEEDFPLFLLSLYQCGKQLLDEIDSTLNRRENPTLRKLVQIELTYLLAQQFIDGTALLEELTKEEKPDADGNRTFYIPSILELTRYDVKLKPEELLYPSRLREHKLYLKDQAGQELGYLSFLDDRLYYVVVPLLEQKRVQIKIQVTGIQHNKRRNRADRYHNLNVWIRFHKKDNKHLPENLNLQIEQLLEKYRANHP